MTKLQLNGLLNLNIITNQPVNTFDIYVFFLSYRGNILDQRSNHLPFVYLFVLLSVNLTNICFSDVHGFQGRLVQCHLSEGHVQFG